jgi:secreted Zn-dependent insulinase-like peptidase
VENIFDKSSNEWKYDTAASMHSEILMAVFSDALAQETYAAASAGLHWRLSKTPSGLILRCSGYSEHLTDFALHVLTLFFADHSFLKENYFKVNRDRYLRTLSTYFESKRADSYASYYTDFFLNSRGKGIDHTIEVTKGTSISTLKDHFERILSSQIQADCLFAGNVSMEESKRLFSGAQKIIAAAQSSSGASSTGTICTTGNFFMFIIAPKQTFILKRSSHTNSK